MRRHLQVLNLPLLFTVLCWAVNFSATKKVYEQIPPPAVALVRTCAVGLFFLLIFLGRKEDRSLPPREDMIRIALQGTLALGIYMILFLEGLKETPAGITSILLATIPLMSASLSVWAKQEQFRPNLFVGGLIAVAGIVVLLVGSGMKLSGGTLHGPLLVLSSAIIWSVSVIIIRPTLDRLSPYRIFVLSVPFALLVMIPYGAKAALAVNWSEITPTTWAYFAHVSLLSGGLAFITYYIGVRQLGAGPASAYQYLVPPGATILAALINHERLLPIQFLGMFIVLVGVISGSTLVHKWLQTRKPDIGLNRGI